MTWQFLVGGLSGALSVGLGAYGSHGMTHKAEVYKNSFDAGVRYQMIHSLLLLVTPVICASHRKHANVAGGLITAGLLLFSGSCCLVGIMEDRSYGKLAPYGGRFC